MRAVSLDAALWLRPGPRILGLRDAAARLAAGPRTGRDLPRDELPRRLSYLALGAPLAGPSSQLVAPGNVTWLQPLSATVMTIETTLRWSFTTHLPIAPALAGLQFSFQPWTTGPTTFPAQTSNGLFAELGF